MADLFQVGDVVLLKSGGLQMTVIEVARDHGVRTAWMDRIGQGHVSYLPMAALVKLGLVWSETTHEIYCPLESQSVQPTNAENYRGTTLGS